MAQMPLDAIPTELKEQIAMALDPSSISNLRLTNSRMERAAHYAFKMIVFAHFIMSATKSAFEHLYTAVRSIYGSAIQSITIRMSGFEPGNSGLYNSIRKVFDTLSNRNQQVKLKISVNAMSRTNDHQHELRTLAIYEFCHRWGTALRILNSPLILDLPSPFERTSLSPLRSTLFSAISRLTAFHDTTITFETQSAFTHVNYNVTTKTLTLEGLEVYHFHELQHFFRLIDFGRLSIDNSVVNAGGMIGFLGYNEENLEAVEIKKSLVYKRWSDGDLGFSSWRLPINVLATLPVLDQYLLEDLWNEDYREPAWLLGDPQLEPQIPCFSTYDRHITIVNQRRLAAEID